MSITPVGVSGLGAFGNGSELGRDAFLNLLVLQLRNQDPLNPQNNEAMLAQLAEFSQLEELQNLSLVGQSEVNATESVNNAIATTLIGKEVKAVGDTFSYEEGTSEHFEYVLPTSGEVEVSVLDAEGNVVYTESLGNREQGFGEFTWDGTDADGEPVKAGTYQIRVTQRGAEGSQDAVTFVTDTVTGVRFADGITYLLLGDRRVSLSDVLEINAPSTVLDR